jgi:hypothetical protein
MSDIDEQFELHKQLIKSLYAKLEKDTRKAKLKKIEENIENENKKRIRK